MSAHKVPLYKKFLEPDGSPAPAVFPIPEGELAKITHVLSPQSSVHSLLPPVHPEARVFTATSLEGYVLTLDDAACMQLLAALRVVVEPANERPNQQN